MTTLRIARTELERLFSSSLSRLAVLAVLLVPALYAGFHLYAQDDPYGSLSRVPAAIVVHDEGVEQPDGTPLNAGFDVAGELSGGDAFDWTLVAEEDAEEGIEDGRYEFALVIPEGFTASLVAPDGGTQPPAQVTVRTDQAGSYLSPSITDRITDSVRDALAAQVGPEAADTFLVGFAEIRDDLSRASKDAASLRDAAGRGAQDAGRLERAAERVADAADDLGGDNDRISSRAGSISRLSSQTVRDYQRVRSTLISRMNRMKLTAVERQFLLGAYGFLGQRLTVTNRAIQNSANGLRGLGPDTSDVTADARALARDARAMRGTLDELRAGGAELKRGLDGVSGGLPEEQEIGTATRDGLAEAIGEPVQVENTAATSADSYGEGLAPFLLAVAAWIGGYALLLLVRPLSTRAVAANQKPFRVAFGGWIAPAWLGVLQAALLGAAVVLVVGTEPEDAGWTIGFLLLAALAFIAILHALVAWFGVVGQLLGLAVLVVQLVASGGSFPWQTIPEPLHWMHYAMPLPHAVDGLRRLMFGGAPELAAYDALVLFAWLVVGLTFSALAARRLRTWTVRRIPDPAF